jgi:hypothetical protein
MYSQEHVPLLQVEVYSIPEMERHLAFLISTCDLLAAEALFKETVTKWSRDITFHPAPSCKAEMLPEATG